MRMFRTYFGRLLGAAGRVSETEHARAPACALGAVGSNGPTHASSEAPPRTAKAAIASVLRIGYPVQVSETTFSSRDSR